MFRRMFSRIKRLFADNLEYPEVIDGWTAYSLIDTGTGLDGSSGYNRISPQALYVLKSLELPNEFAHRAVCHKTIKEFASRPTPFPPIIMNGADFSRDLVDGSHRILAALYRGDSTIRAYVRQRAS